MTRKASARGIAERLAKTSPGTAKRTIETAAGLIASARTIQFFRRTPNPGEIEMVKQTDGTYAPPTSFLEYARSTFTEQRARARRELMEADTQLRGTVPDADEDTDDDDEIPNAR